MGGTKHNYMKIDNGVNIDTKFTNSIVISNDDTNWCVSISKCNICEIKGIVDVLGNAYVLLYHCVSQKEIKLSEITNQSTWTNDQDGLNNAVADISSWI